MLRELAVQNLALIEDVRVELEPGFCAWTGETGAGKTLLLEALGLLLGERGSAELLRAGASAYVLKQSAPSELLQAIRVAASGGQYLDSTLTARVTAGFLAREGRRLGKPSAVISERESEVLRLIASGYSNKEIAARLDLSVKTVEAHKANAMRKLGLNGRIDIVKYAILQGWMENS